MATGTTQPSNVTPPPKVAADSDQDRFIQRQLDKTRWHVKIVDLVSALMALTATVLVFLLVVAVIDHWVVELGFWSRSLALLVLIGGCLYYSWNAIWPLLVHRINDAYAARAIESNSPALKNSLINFLMFRSDHRTIREGVSGALRQRAATDLSHIQVESAIDRSKLINVGYLVSRCADHLHCLCDPVPEERFSVGATRGRALGGYPRVPRVS